MGAPNVSMLIDVSGSYALQRVQLPIMYHYQAFGNDQ